MAFEVPHFLNSKVAHLVNWDLTSLIHGDTDVNQALSLNHPASDLRFQLKTKKQNRNHDPAQCHKAF